MNIGRLANRRAAVTAAAVALTVTLGSAALAPARADDIDLFTGASGQQYAPNLFVLIANQANWGSSIGTDDDGTKLTQREIEHEALEAVFTDRELAGTEGSETDPIQLRVGFGLFANSNSPKGAKVIRHVRPLTESYQDDISSMLYDIDGNELLQTTNNAPYALSFNEAYAYFAGEAPIAGMKDGDHDRDAITTSSDETSIYKSPAAGNCGKNYVVLIGNGQPDSGEDNAAEEALRGRGGVSSDDPIDLDPPNYESNWSDEFARFMEGTEVVPDAVRDDHEQNVRTYVIDVFDPDSNQAGNRTFDAARTWLNSIAQRGGGQYFAAHSTADIKAALQSILNELFAVNDVFAASTLPVSVNVRGTNLNQVYMGVFRPDEKNRTRWQGNLKLYQLAVNENTNTLFLADAHEPPKPAQGDSGFIRSDALSFWTEHWDFWGFDPRGILDSPDDAPDGEVVEKGGVHQQVRLALELARGEGDATFSDDRRLLTATQDDCSGSGCGLVAFEDAATSLDSSLVEWMQGTNNVSDDANDPDALPKNNATTEPADTIRPTIHGDVLHSQPAVINYGDRDGDGHGDVYAYYGANDGIFHAVRGGKDVTGAGEELWGFVPEEFFGRLKQLRDLSDPDSDGKEYFADGSVGVYKHDANDDGDIESADNDRVIIYISMRRGGRLLYALDVTEPSSPEFLWKIDESDTAELGQTWSRPEVSEIKYTASDGTTVQRDVVIFGGGYDSVAEDDGGTPSMGRAIYVADAITGELIWQAGASASDATYNEPVTDMTYAIPSDVTVIDRDNDGFADRLYVGDTGGQLWRADISGHPSPDSGSGWEVYKLASDGEAAGKAERKFLYPPDVVYGEDENGRYDAVLLGTGDRAHPFKDTVVNRFYMFKDRQTGLTVDSNYADTYWPLDPATDLYDATSEPTSVDKAALADKAGWYIDLLNDDGVAAGEKVVSSAVTLGGTTFFNTNEPPDSDTDSCNQTLGIARNYEVSYFDGTGAHQDAEEGTRATRADGGGFPPSPVPVIVEIDGQVYEVVLSGTEASAPPGTTMGRRNPVYWRSQVD